MDYLTLRATIPFTALYETVFIGMAVEPVLEAVL